MIAALFLAMFVLSSDVKLVESGPEDCIDACYTGCVFPNDGNLLIFGYISKQSHVLISD